MKNVYLVNTGNKIRHFLSEIEMKDSGYPMAHKVVTEEEFNSNGCYARIIDNEIIVGKTEKEEEIDGLREQISEIDEQFAVLDAKYLTPRILSDLVIGDTYAISQRAIHEAEASFLRIERESLKQRLNQLLAL